MTSSATPANERVPATPTTSDEQMRAIVYKQYGSADVMSMADIDRPVIEAGEVLVQVRAAGLDRGAWHVMTGLPYAGRLAFGVRAPKVAVLGGELAGVVVAAGSDVTRFQPGDEVFGVGKGSFAEFAAARQDRLSPKPSNLTFEQAAALPISAVTALQGLCDVGHLEAGQKVLVIGASGGVGTFAVQIAKALGADVTGVCSAGKVDLVRSIGADHVIDYTANDFADGGKQYDLILDIGGNSSLKRLRHALTPKGTLVITGGEDGGKWLGVGRQFRSLFVSPFVGQRLKSFLAKSNRARLERLTELVENGHIVPVIEKTYPLNEAPDAMRHLAGGHARGKLVIIP